MQVKFFATYISVVGQRVIDIPAPSSVLDLLTYLSQKYPEFSTTKKLLTDDGLDMRDDVICMVNGRHIIHMGGVNCPLTDRDVVAITPQMAGG
ncbi:MAG: MoaD family protein [Coriobacteriales bacterium]|nr:MoaD family protein [Coriobacteriales bacterium]